jgi:hypothetical protein
MKKIYLIGDCHVSRVSEHYNKNKAMHNLVDVVFWGKAAKKVWDLDFKKMYEEEELSSGKEEQLFYGDGVIPFSDIKDGGILLSWFGYVDIRTFLSGYDNADEVAKKYIKEIVNNFKNSTIVIIEPLPQFTEMMLKYEGISPHYTYQQRLNQNKKFLDSLHKYAHDAGITNFIFQSQILNAVGVKELTPDMTHNKAHNPVDGLKDEYNSKILDLFIKKSLELLNDWSWIR